MKYSQNALTASSILFFSGLAVVFSNELTAKSQQKKILLSKEKIIELNKEIDTLQTSVQVTKSHLSQIQQ